MAAARPSPPRQRIGAHVPVARGLAAGGLQYADAVGAEAVQVFVGNPRGWAYSYGRPDDDRAFRARVESLSLPVFVHAPYLVNLGAPDPVTGRRSADAVAHALRRGHDIGALGVVVHTGSAVRNGQRAPALRRVRERLLPLLDGIAEDGPELLLEPMAGQGQALCATAEELGPYLDVLDRHPRARVCLDTCHAYAAGHDIARPGGVHALLDAVEGAAGRERLALLHANDSEDACGSHRDRHANIGRGRIRRSPFGELFSHPSTATVPVVVETPGSVRTRRRDVDALRRLRDRR